jgi:hypothetical protein
MPLAILIVVVAGIAAIGLVALRMQGRRSGA